MDGRADSYKITPDGPVLRTRRSSGPESKASTVSDDPEDTVFTLTILRVFFSSHFNLFYFLYYERRSRFLFKVCDHL